MPDACSIFKIDDILQSTDQTLCQSLMPRGQNCSTPLNPGIYAETKLSKFPIPEISSDILNYLKIVKTMKIELTLMDSNSNDLACMWTKIDIHVSDDEENSGMKMFNSNLILGAMLLLVLHYI